MSATVTIARWEYRRAVRSRWTITTAAVFAVLTFVVTMAAMGTIRDLGLDGIGPASASLVNLAVLVPSLIGVVVGAGSLIGAGEQGFLSLMAAQPIDRSSLAVGAFLGLTRALWSTLAIGLGVASIVLAGAAGPDDVLSLGILVATTAGVSSASVAIGIAIAAVVSSRVQAISAAVAGWIALALGVDLAIAALAPTIHLGPAGLLATILMDPIESGRILALLGTDLEGSALGPFGAYVVGRFGSTGAVLILGGALVLWTALPLMLARAVLRRRDL